MTRPEYFSQLIHDDAIIFEQGLKHLGKIANIQEGMDVNLFAELCNHISALHSIGAIARHHRITSILQYVPTTKPFLETITQSAANWAPEVRNAVARVLPPNLKQAVFSRPIQSYPTELLKPAPSTGAVQSSEPSFPDLERPVVLLLGTYQEQEANRNLLERERYRTTRANSLDEFRRSLAGDICGVVIAGSWWKTLEETNHQCFLKELLAFSSLFWVKIDNSAYGHNRTLQQDIREVRCQDGQIQNISYGESCALNEADLVALREAANRLCNSNQVRLCPADIGPQQSQVLIAGVAEHVRSRHYTPGFRLEEIGTTTLHGGRSDALIVRVQPDDGGLPLIAKISSAELLRQEMGRFNHFILPWDAVLQPRFHFHGDKGAIIFGLVDSIDVPLKAAPTLEDTLQRVLRIESGAPSQGLPPESDLLSLINRTIEKITRLNEQPCQSNSYSSFAWIDVEPLNIMLANKISWNLPNIVGGIDPLALRHDAVKRVQAAHLSRAATVHGDIHLRNILVRGDRDPFLIDYALAGPGHPCFDLVRFESSLLFQMFRVTADEATIRALLKNIISADNTLSDVQVQFPSLCASIGNRLAIQAATKCRAACFELLRRYGGGAEDYLSMKLVIACQALTMSNLQASIVRAAVVIAAELLAEQQLKPHSASSPRYQAVTGLTVPSV